MLAMAPGGVEEEEVEAGGRGGGGSGLLQPAGGAGAFSFDALSDGDKADALREFLEMGSIHDQSALFEALPPDLLLARPTPPLLIAADTYISLLRSSRRFCCTWIRDSRSSATHAAGRC